MKYHIEGTPLPVVVCTLERGESMITESGGMSWMSDGIEMSTNMSGGLMKGLGRMLGGESLFLATYTCSAPNGYVAFSSSFAGDILPFELDGASSIIVQKSGFLAAEEGVTLSMFFQKKFGAGMFGGEGFIMQRVAGKGMVFVEIDGHCVKKELAPGEIIKVDSGNIAAFTETVGMDIEMIKGVKNILFGGEGMFNTVLKGPGTVWLQTMPASAVAKTLIPFLPTSNK